MQLYNTLAKQVQTIQPGQDSQFSIYSCGPTVYDHIHIGNLSSFIFADSLRRALTSLGYKVKHVMNFTDVDDKTIGRSQQKYSELEPMQALLKLTGEYSEVFLSDMAAAGNAVDDMVFVKATENIATMQTLIRELQERGFAYLAEDGIYFSIEAYTKSGKAYGQLTEVNAASTSNARIQNDEYDKDSAHDFALWKAKKTGEPAWDFEINGQNLAGRPGWHIECSAMSTTSLGQPFDIHTGGVDLMFPHHENEIAQSTAADGDIYARIFAHNEHLLIDGQKMSKSLNNFYTLDTIRDKGFEPLAFRLLVLQSHYRKQVHFSWDNLQAAQNRLKNWQAMADLRWQAMETDKLDTDWATPEAYIKEKLAQDLNTPQAITTLDWHADQVSTIAASARPQFEAFLSFVDSVFGLGLSQRPDITEAQKQLIRDRQAARQQQDWPKSDELRDALIGQGLGLRDTAQGATWFRL
jgi:cysteinyl-tRNA synthetase